MQLFRPEALRGQDRLHGDVVLVPPVSWQLLGGFLLATVLVAALFAATARYSKVIAVSGRLAGDRGSVQVVAPSAGIVSQLLVREGQQVAAGAPLARISTVTADENVTLLVNAAEAGTVARIHVRPGDTVASGRPILSIVPRGTRLRAEVEVPPAAVGFVARGQIIRLAVDALPHQAHGTVAARIDQVSSEAVPVTASDGTASEAFIVRASLPADVVAFGRGRRLLPGMTVSARITTRSRTIAEWLFEPLHPAARP